MEAGLDSGPFFFFSCRSDQYPKRVAIFKGSRKRKREIPRIQEAFVRGSFFASWTSPVTIGRNAFDTCLPTARVVKQ